MLGVAVRLVLSKDGMTPFELYEYLGGQMGSFEQEVTRECEKTGLDPHNEQHRELVDVEPSDNYAYYMCDVGKCPDGIDVVQPQDGGNPVIFVDGTEFPIDLPCPTDKIVPKLDDATGKLIARLKQAFSDVAFRWVLDENKY